MTDNNPEIIVYCYRCGKEIGTFNDFQETQKAKDEHAKLCKEKPYEQDDILTRLKKKWQRMVKN